MQVFKTALRIIRTKPSLLIYVLIPLVMTFFYVSTTPKSTTSFSQKPVTFTVQNLDQANPLSLALEEVMAKNNKALAYPTDPQVLRNQLFYMQINYVLTIPEGFFDDYAAYLAAPANSSLSPPRLLRTESVASDAKQMNQIVAAFLQVLNVKLSADPDQDLQVLADSLVRDLAAETTVRVISSARSWTPANDFFFRFSSYGLTATLIYIVGFLFNAFRDKKVLSRQLASPTSYSRLNLEIGFAIVICTLGLILLYTLAAFAYFGTQMFSTSGWLALANMFIFTFVILSFSTLVISIMKSENSISVLGNVIPLALSFFGGAFIPLQFLSKPVQQIANFLPTYWYTKTVDELGQLSSFDLAGIQSILNNFFVLAAFGLTFTFASMGISHYLNRQSGENLAVSKKY